MRLLGFLFRLALIVALIVWLADQPGTAHVVWRDYVINTSAAFLGILIAAIAFGSFLIYRIWRFILDGPRFWRMRSQLNKLHEGQNRLAEGLAAIAAGNAVEAGRLAVRARKLLGVTPATQLLQAQAAQLAGDHRAAKELFLRLTNDPGSAVLGYRGLIMEAVRERNWDEVERQAEKLNRLKPDTPWLGLIWFELETRRRNWREAGAALAQASRARLCDPLLAKRYQAALLLAGVEGEVRQGQTERALQTAEQAARLAPGWLPALLALAQRQYATDHRRAALRTIEKTWASTPHPQLAALYLTASHSENALEAYKQAERLTRANGENPVSQIFLAETALAADLWGEARRHLMMLVNRKEATQAVFRLLAKLEQRTSGDERAAAQWLMKAAEATPDPRWLCAACGGAHDEWQGLCAYCGSFNRLEWQTPGVSREGDKVMLISGVVESLT
jgi:HemY protein